MITLLIVSVVSFGFSFFEVSNNDLDFFVGAPFCAYPSFVVLKSQTLRHFFMSQIMDLKLRRRSKAC